MVIFGVIKLIFVLLRVLGNFQSSPLLCGCSHKNEGVLEGSRGRVLSVDRCCRRKKAGAEGVAVAFFCFIKL